MTDAPEKARRRWFPSAPDRCVLGLLALEAFLLLSAWFRWLPFNQHKGYTVLICLAAVGVALFLMFLWFLAALVFRLRFQYSILSLLLLVVVVAVPFAWLETEMNAARKQQEVVDAIILLHGHVGYAAHPTDPLGDIVNPVTQAPAPAWLRNLLGDDFFANVVVVYGRGGLSDDAFLVPAKGLPQLDALVFTQSSVTDSGLKQLGGASQLRFLYLTSANVSDSGMEHFKGLLRLRWLGLGGTKVGDAGLECLRGMTKLNSLDLNRTGVTDAGLDHLKPLVHLEWLDISGTKVTDEGVAKLKQALPNCRILH